MHTLSGFVCVGIYEVGYFMLGLSLGFRGLVWCSSPHLCTTPCVARALRLPRQRVFAALLFSRAGSFYSNFIIRVLHTPPATSAALALLHIHMGSNNCTRGSQCNAHNYPRCRCFFLLLAQKKPPLHKKKK